MSQRPVANRTLGWAEGTFRGQMVNRSDTGRIDNSASRSAKEAAERPRQRRKSRAEVYKNMSAIRSRDNRAELRLRQALHALGLRFRLHRADVEGRPDITFIRERIAVFVDGDFWHARLLRESGIDVLRERMTAPDMTYWVDKFNRRIERDDFVNRSLRSSGWMVLRFWESEVLADTQQAARVITKAVRKRRRRSN
jgi:DNA mismatch endonuclease, patch repair protein